MEKGREQYFSLSNLWKDFDPKWQKDAAASMIS